MSHLPFIGIKNFRIFRYEQKFTFRPVTILTGTNSSGKTSVIQALLLLKRYLGQQFYGRSSFKSFDQIEKLSRSQIDERLGDFSKLLNNKSSAAGNLVLEFKVPCRFKHDMNDDITLVLKILQSGEKVYEGQLVYFSFEGIEDKENIFSIEKQGNSWLVNINYLYFFNKFKGRFFDYLDVGKDLAWKDHLFEFEEIDEKNDLEYDEAIANEISEGQSDEPAKEDLKSFLDVYTNEFLESKEKAGLILDTFPEWILKLSAYADEYFESTSLEEQTVLEIKIEIQKAVNKVLREFVDANYPKGNPSILLLRNFRFLYTPPHKDGILSSILDLISNPIKVLNNKEGTVELKFDKNLNQYLKFFGYRVTIVPFRGRSGWTEDADGRTDDERFFGVFIYQNLLQALEDRAHSFLRVGHLPSIRNIVKRVYGTKKEETEFSELIVQFLEYGIDNHKDIIEYLNYFIREFEIGDSILIEQSSGGAANQFYIANGASKTLLADLGYGISQFMPILLKIAVQAYQSRILNTNNYSASTICIEEPETNLHPALQSKLADLFMEAYQRFNIQFIIETHSEYLIRKLQYLAGRKEAATDDILMYYFQRRAASGKEVDIKTIEINEYGGLTDEFGSGFFDEATHWKFELVKLNNPQKN